METKKPSQELLLRLESQTNIWFGSVRQDQRPHLVPVWFIIAEGRIYIGTDPNSVKIKNIRNNPHVVLALEDGTHPVIVEGLAAILDKPYRDIILNGFYKKYEWDINTDTQYHQVVEVRPQKWLSW